MERRNFVNSGILTALLALLLAAPPVPAVDHGSAGGVLSSTMTSDAQAQGKPQGVVSGKMIAQRSVEGYQFMYHLLDLKERAALMKGMEGMEMPGMSNSPEITNHLMVYIAGPDGKLLSGTVGFQVTAPDGKVQSTMTMGMSGGYGADVILKSNIKYGIKTKAVVGGKTLIDEFTYEVK